MRGGFPPVRPPSDGGGNRRYLSNGFKWLSVMGLFLSFYSLPKGGLSFILPHELEKFM